MPNVSLCAQENEVHYNPIVPPRMDIITYSASTKLSETTNSNDSGLHTNAFNTTIKSHTFEDGVGIIEFDNDVTSIGTNAFLNCTELKITIPNSVTSIGIQAFNGCGFRNIIIPSSVTSIDMLSFNYCQSLRTVTIEATIPPTLGILVFQNTSLTTIYVPSESVDTYKTASRWSDYASSIKPIQ